MDLLVYNCSLVLDIDNLCFWHIFLFADQSVSVDRRGKTTAMVVFFAKAVGSES